LRHEVNIDGLRVIVTSSLEKDVLTGEFPDLELQDCEAVAKALSLLYPGYEVEAMPSTHPIVGEAMGDIYCSGWGKGNFEFPFLRGTVIKTDSNTIWVSLPKKGPRKAHIKPLSFEEGTATLSIKEVFWY